MASNAMLDLLLKTSNNESYQNHNDDDDFGEVLEGCKDEHLIGKKIRCSDGKERVFSFEN